MKRFLILGVMASLGLVGFGTFAEEASAEQGIKITSFQRTSSERGIRTAEVCGRAWGMPLPALLRVEADYNTSNKGIYGTMTTGDGNFCTIILTYVGRVQVLLDGTEAAAPITSAKLSDVPRR